MEEGRQMDTFVYEATLMRRWSDVLISMINNRKAENRVMGFISKQIEYITYLFRSVLFVQSVISTVNSVSTRGLIEQKNSAEIVTLYLNRQEKNNGIYGCVNYSAYILNDHWVMTVEQIPFIVSVIFNQAKQLYLTNVTFAKRTNTNRKNSTCDTKFEMLYKEAVDLALKRVKENAPNVFSNDFEAAKFVLEMIYESAIDSKVLRRVLKPYLKEFSISTHENCWFLEEWKNRINNDEMEALRVFSALVSEKKIKFKVGLLDALQKGTLKYES